MLTGHLSQVSPSISPLLRYHADVISDIRLVSSVFKHYSKSRDSFQGISLTTQAGRSQAFSYTLGSSTQKGLRASAASRLNMFFMLNLMYLYMILYFTYCTVNQDCTACTEDMQTQIYIPPKGAHFVVGSFLHFCIGACYELHALYTVLCIP